MTGYPASARGSWAEFFPGLAPADAQRVADDFATRILRLWLKLDDAERDTVISCTDLDELAALLDRLEADRD